METWVFVAIFALAGLLIITCSFGKGELSLIYVIAGTSTFSFGSLAFSEKFKKWLNRI